jgi:hypothetical protein
VPYHQCTSTTYYSWSTYQLPIDALSIYLFSVTQIDQVACYSIVIVFNFFG